MKLKTFRVTNYKSIDDSSEVKASDITCLVGKNDAGKTAVLEALGRLNAAGSLRTDFTLDDFPRHNLLEYKKRHKTEPAPAIEALFEFSDDELSNLRNLFGEGTLKGRTVEIEKRYDNVRYFSIPTEEHSYVKHLVRAAQLPNSIAGDLSKSRSFRDLLAKLRSTENPDKGFQDFHYEMESLHDRPLVKRIISELKIPEFFYFNDYSLMPGDISIGQMKRIENGDQPETPGLRTARMLLDRIGATPDDFMKLEKYNDLRSELEVASNQLSDQIFDFWSQSQDLEVEISLQPVFNKARLVEDTVLSLRIKDVRQRISIPFESRSRGFVWFFSFMIAFGEFQNPGQDVVLLLDEPGILLHGKGQRDLLRYFDRLAQNYQIVYATHSPFMIDSERTDRVRVVMDSDEGTVVANRLSDADGEAMQPVKAALGAQLVDSLFSDGDQRLLVRDASDLLLLTLASEALSKKDRIMMGGGWQITPAGGLNRVATFFAMMGDTKANVAVLLDGQTTDLIKLQPLLEDGKLADKNLISVAEIIDKDEGTVEDFFDREAYLKVVAHAYSEDLGEGFDIDDFVKAPLPIIRALSKYWEDEVIGDGYFNRMRVATAIVRDSKAQKNLFSGDALDNFEQVFSKAGRILK